MVVEVADHRNLWDIQGRLEYDAQCVLDRGKALEDTQLIRQGRALQRTVRRFRIALERR